MESAESYRQLNYLEMMWGILEYFRLKRENVSKKDHFNQGVCTYLPPWAGAHANPPAFVSSGGRYKGQKALSTKGRRSAVVPRVSSNQTCEFKARANTPV